ncbi:hypothetical protein HMPREF1033_03014 [Tannerella sp. 6_1_58FAA_CT1]|nr:hypothetical protein HMPREF1033_03014 [Tannerella sp. 6_1_58FAA_CT1]
MINPYHKNNGYLLYFQDDNRYFLSLKGMPKDNEKG